MLQRQAPDSDSLFSNFKSERIKKRIHNPRDEASLALTGVGVVDGIITNLAVVDMTPQGLKVVEMAPGVTRELLQAKTGVSLI